MANARILGTSHADSATITVSGGPPPMVRAVFDLNTSTGTQDITVSSAVGRDQTPIAAMFVCAKLTNSDGDFNNTACGLSVGFFDGTNSVVFATQDQHGQGTTNSQHRGATDECIMVLDTDGSVLVEANGDSFLTNGVRINIGATNASDYRCWVSLFFDGTGSAAAGTFTSASTQDESTTVSAGLSSDIVLAIAPAATVDTFTDAAIADAVMSLGFVDVGGNQVGARWTSVDNVGTTDVQAYVRNDRIPFDQSGNGLEFGSFTSTGFDVTTRGTTGGGTAAYLALNMPSVSAYVDILDTPTSTGNADFTTASIDTESALFITTSVEAENTNEADDDAESFGVGGADVDTDAATGQIASEDGQSFADTETRYETAALRSAGANTNDDVEANTFTEITNGFRLNFATVHGTAKKWPYMALRHDSVLAASNVTTTDVQEVWRSASTADQTITFDFGSAVKMDMVYLENCNFSGSETLTWETSTDNFSSTQSTEAFSLFSKNLTYKAALLYMASQQSAQYGRLIVSDSSNSDGYFEIGRLKVGEYLDAPTSKNVSIGPGFKYSERGQLTSLRGGGYSAEQRNPRREITVRWEFAHDDDNWDIDANSFAEILEHVGVRDDMVLDVYPEEGTDRERRHILLGRKIRDTGLQGHFVDGSGTLHSRIEITVSEAL